MTRRLFFGIALDDRSRGTAAALIERLASAGGGEASRGARVLRWISRGNLHVTVRFLGATQPRGVRDLQDLCRTPLRARPFRIRLDRLRTFPPRGRPRVVCLEASGGREEAQALRVELDGRLSGLGWPVETRPLQPHLTLARCSASSPRALRSMVRRIEETWADAPAEVEWGVTHLTLFESVLSSAGASYAPLATSSLSSAG